MGEGWAGGGEEVESLCFIYNDKDYSLRFLFIKLPEYIRIYRARYINCLYLHILVHIHVHSHILVYTCLYQRIFALDRKHL